MTIVEAGLLSYSHVGRAPAVVYCRNVLHHLPDFWKGVALQRIAGLLAPNGVLLVRDIVYDFEPASAPRGSANGLPARPTIPPLATPPRTSSSTSSRSTAPTERSSSPCSSRQGSGSSTRSSGDRSTRATRASWAAEGAVRQPTTCAIE